MKYTMKAHKTRFNSCNFRSRLEARWAAFFDMCGWEWVYEPIDFKGWSPDFLLRGHSPLYVEVKPILKFDEETANRIAWALRDVDGCEPLLLGIAPFASEYSYTASIGWLGQDMRNLPWHLGETDPDCHGFDFGEAVLVDYNQKYCESGGYLPEGCHVKTHQREQGLGIAHSTQSYSDRITGHYIGGSTTGPEKPAVDALWRQASNSVQWFPIDSPPQT